MVVGIAAMRGKKRTMICANMELILKSSSKTPESRIRIRINLQDKTCRTKHAPSKKSNVYDKRDIAPPPNSKLNLGPFLFNFELI